MTALENGPNRHANADESRPTEGRERENGHNRVHATFIGRCWPSAFRHPPNPYVSSVKSRNRVAMQNQGRRANCLITKTYVENRGLLETNSVRKLDAGTRISLPLGKPNASVV